MKSLSFRVIWVLVCGVFTASAAALELPAVFSDGMVLQRDMPVPIWGKAVPGRHIRVVWSDGKSFETEADANGDWRLNLPAMEASYAAHQVHVIASTVNESPAEGEDRFQTREHIRFTDVLVGEVWHCSGQSNMQWSVARSKDAAQEIASADDRELRMFRVPLTADNAPRFSSGGQWLPATGEHVGGFSAVGYYFGRKLRASQGVPIGLIDTSWGGVSAESYTSIESQANNPIIDDQIIAYRSELAQRRGRADDSIDPAQLPERHADPGPTSASAAYVKPGFDDSQWAEVQLPAMIEQTDLGAIDGGVWFRKMLELPEGWGGRALTLSLGAIDDFDGTFVNGTPVGATGPETPRSWTKARNYEVPAELVTGDAVTVAVRVFDHYGEGGFVGRPEQMRLGLADDPAENVSLAGAWRAWADQAMSPNALRGAHEVRRPQHTPGALLHGMIHPVAPLAHRGVIWYQGESNASRAAAYRTLLPTMIEDWRTLWAQPGEHRDTPFLIVQLANFKQPHEQPPATDTWGELRDSQAAVATTVPNVWITTAIDLGEADDIHPGNKQDVGLRLARLAEFYVYGDASVVPVGPTLRELGFYKGKDQAVWVLFDHAEGLVTTDGQPPRGFAIRPLVGERTWVWAEAELDGESVKLRHPDGILGPFEVRYAYGINPADGPQGINLVNGERLPAMPFRTDPVPTVE